MVKVSVNFSILKHLSITGTIILLFFKMMTKWKFLIMLGKLQSYGNLIRKEWEHVTKHRSTLIWTPYLVPGRTKQFLITWSYLSLRKKSMQLSRTSHLTNHQVQMVSTVNFLNLVGILLKWMCLDLFRTFMLGKSQLRA